MALDRPDAPLSPLAGGHEEAFRRLVETVRDYAIFMLDPEGRISSWNLGAERIKGYTADEAMGRHFSMFYQPEAIARGWPQEELKRATALGRYEDEGWRVRKDGSAIWANVVITAIQDDEGRLLGFSKVTRDLTERRRHEEALREREENLRLLVEGVRDHAMFLLDGDGVVRSWNAGAERVFGWATGEVLGREGASLFTPDDRAAGRPRAELSLALNQGFCQQEGWRQRADGTPFWARVATTVLREASGALRGFTLIVHDLSERRRVEVLESEGKRIGEFIAMLSHELRNPLAPIRNAVAVLDRSDGTPVASWAADVIGRQVTHLARLVDDLLDVSRITSGKIRLENAALELNTLVRAAADAQRPTVQSYGHQLELRLPDHPVPLSGDSTRLTQVVVNLLTNAAKYTPRGGRIAVSLDSEDGLATLEVSDNGIGLSPAMLQQAFEPFVQGERTLDRSEGGLGIGLTLVRRIVELHGGSVWAESAGIGHGATFTVTLPLADWEPVADPAGQAGVAGTLTSVMVVDDNPDAAESLAMLLRMSGHEVEVASNGEAALALAERFRPQVVLLDLGLPGMDGFEVARRLRARPELSGTRLIAITGYGQASDRQATAAAGFERHLTKPVDVDSLFALLG